MVIMDWYQGVQKSAMGPFAIIRPAKGDVKASFSLWWTNELNIKEYELIASSVEDIQLLTR
jgi:hypothetical protein